jgi:hypothetical protein
MGPFLTRHPRGIVYHGDDSLLEGDTVMLVKGFLGG